MILGYGLRKVPHGYLPKVPQTMGQKLSGHSPQAMDNGHHKKTNNHMYARAAKMTTVTIAKNFMSLLAGGPLKYGDAAFLEYTSGSTLQQFHWQGRL